MEHSGIAILGGSFDPPHRSHARLLAAAGQHLPVAQTRVIPAGDHPHKQGRGMSAAGHRLAMSRLAFGGLAGVRVDDREIRRGGLSFTVDTLTELATENPDRALFFLIGSDNLPLLPSWREHHRVLALATIVTYPRAGHAIDAGALDGLDLTPDERDGLLQNVLPMPADAVAATTIRERWRRGERAIDDLEPAVVDYIVAHDLYSA